MLLPVTSYRPGARLLPALLPPPATPDLPLLGSPLSAAFGLDFRPLGIAVGFVCFWLVPRLGFVAFVTTCPFVERRPCAAAVDFCQRRQSTDRTARTSHRRCRARSGGNHYKGDPLDLRLSLRGNHSTPANSYPCRRNPPGDCHCSFA